MRLMAFMLLASLLLVAMMPAAAQDGSLTLTVLGRYETGVIDEGAAEIAAYHAGSQSLFVTNGATGNLDILNISDPTAPTLAAQVDLSAYGAANSVAVWGDVAAVAVDAENAQDPGSILFLDMSGNVLSSVQVGSIPDMVTFTPDGTKVLVANEGEPNDDYTVDPEGSVSIIDVSGGAEAVTQDNVTTVGFTDFNADGERAAELPAEVRIYGPNATVAQDLEPEYIAVSPDGSTAYVTLQEANAVALIDIAAGEVVAIAALGFIDRSAPGFGIDASNEDGAINIQNWPVFGMYQPDSIVAIEINGATYLLTANEGDSRDYEDVYSEEARVADVTLDPTVFPNAAELQAEDMLGRLLITTAQGDTDGDGDFDVLYALGGRSFTIWGADGSLVFDSGDQFEQFFAANYPEAFNSQGLNESFDNRSDDKGPEPEGLDVGVVNGVPYAFIGLERMGGVLVYDLSDPTAPTLVTYANNTDWQGSFDEQTFTGDISPEGVLFITAEESPTGNALLVLTHEVSGTTTIYEVK